MMEIVKDKDLIFDTEKFDVILVGTSIYNMLTQGFQSKMSLKYPEIVTANNSTAYADRRKLGKRITVQGNPVVSLMYICGYPHSRRDFLDYDALEHCLLTANQEFKGMKVATTLLGTSMFDGNGDRDKCLKIIEESTPDMKVTVYDYVQLKKRVEIAQEFRKFNVYADNNEWDKYYELVSHKDELLRKLYLRY